MNEQIIKLYNEVVKVNLRGGRLSLSISHSVNTTYVYIIDSSGNTGKGLGDTCFFDENGKEETYSYGIDNLIKLVCQI